MAVEGLTLEARCSWASLSAGPLQVAKRAATQVQGRSAIARCLFNFYAHASGAQAHLSPPDVSDDAASLWNATKSSNRRLSFFPAPQRHAQSLGNLAVRLSHRAHFEAVSKEPATATMEPSNAAASREADGAPQAAELAAQLEATQSETVTVAQPGNDQPISSSIWHRG